MTVEDVFLMKNRGLIVLGWENDNTISFKVGDFVKIKKPDGSTSNFQISSLENLLFTKYSREYSSEKHGKFVGIVFKGLSKKDVPRESIIELVF